MSNRPGSCVYTHKMSHPTPPVSRTDFPFDEDREAREHEAFMRTLNPVIATAAEWHTRREDGLGPTEEAQFQQWLGADPAHGKAYGQLEQGFNTLRSLSDAQVAHLRAPSPSKPVASAHAGEAVDATDVPTNTPTDKRAGTRTPVHSRNTQRPAPRSPSRLAWLMPSPAAVVLGCALLVSTGIGWHLWHQPTFTQKYATQQGQRITTTLPDGSELVLDVKTQADVALYRDRREVRLGEGQAMFSVAPDPAKPFRVLAGPASITVVGTRFSVRYATTGSKAGAVEVAVEEGRVSVDGMANPSQPTSTGTGALLTAGQIVQVSAAGVVGEVAALPVSSVAPWRKGKLRFSNARLSDVIEEMERYGSTGLAVEDPQVADLRMGGSFEIARPGVLAQVLPQILPVKLKPRSDGKQEVVSAR